MATLPLDVQPATLARQFPGIADTLAGLWAKPEAMQRCLQKLLANKRGRRREFPIRVSRELHALKAYHATIQADRKEGSVTLR